MAESIYGELGLEGVVFILIILICIVGFKLSVIPSIILAGLGAGIIFLIKSGAIGK